MWKVGETEAREVMMTKVKERERKGKEKKRRSKEKRR